MTTIPPQTLRPPESPALSRPSQISSDFNAFLRMLTAQIQNQDPLEPMAASDFAVQLATFANVEQSTQTNSLLRELIAQSQGAVANVGVDWLGRDLVVAGAHRNDSGSVVVELPDLPDITYPAELHAIAENGESVARVAFVSGQEKVAFGPPETSPLPAGIYHYVVTGRDIFGQAVTVPANWTARAAEIRFSLTGSELQLENGQIVPAEAAQRR